MVGIRRVWVSNNRQRESTDAGIRARIQTDYRTTHSGDLQNAGIRQTTEQQNLGIRGMQVSSNRRRGTQKVTECRNLTDRKELHNSGVDGVRASDNRQRESNRIQYEKCSGMVSGYGHQEPTGFREKNRECGSKDTVTRNHLSFDDVVLRWFRSYLTGRSRHVQYGGATSTLVLVSFLWCSSEQCLGTSPLPSLFGRCYSHFGQAWFLSTCIHQ